MNIKNNCRYKDAMIIANIEPINGQQRDHFGRDSIQPR